MGSALPRSAGPRLTAPSPIVRPLFRFFGSKWQLAPHYPEPDYPVIVEPFAGSAGYSTRYYDRTIVLVEKDPKIAAIWRWLIGADPAEILALPLLAPGETIPETIADAPRWFLGFWVTLTAAKPQSRMVPSSGSIPDSFWNAKIRARTAENVQRIRHWTIIEGDYTASPDGRATWFVDPPYQPANAAHGRGAVDAYGHGTPDFGALANWLATRRGQVIVCENVGADWLPFEPFRRGHAAPRKSRIDAGKGCVTHEAICHWRAE